MAISGAAASPNMGHYTSGAGIVFADDFHRALGMVARQPFKEEELGKR